MARKTKQEKQLEQEFDAAFKQYCNNYQFDMLDLGKLHDCFNTERLSGKDVETAIVIARDKYKKN